MKHYLLAGLLLAAVPAVAQTKTKSIPTTTRYELRGIATYFFNQNLGNKPDIGAKAFIIKESAIKKGTNIVSLQTYLINHDLVEHTGSSSGPKLEKLPDEMTPADKIQALEGEALAAQQEILQNPSTSEVTADGNGVFLKKLAPGYYIVLIRSANRSRINPLEMQGQMIVREVSIKDDDKEVSVNFKP